MMRKGANKDDAAAIAERIRLLKDSELMQLLKEQYAPAIMGAVKSICTARGYGQNADDIFVQVVKTFLAFGCRRIRAFKGDISFRIFLASLCREKTLELLKKRFGYREASYSDNAIASHSADYLNGVNPDLEYLSLERRELFVSACDIVDSELSAFSSKERLIYAARIKDKIPFKEMSSMIKVESSSREFEKLMRKLKLAALPRIARALDHYYG